MFAVEAMILGDLDRERTWGIGERSAGDAAAAELPPARGNAYLLGWAGSRVSTEPDCAQLGVDQPDRLRQERQKQGCGEKLRTAEPFAREELGHKAGRSVLP